MKDGHWIALHKQIKYWLPYKGKYNELEALISHTLDIEDGKSWTINGYAKLWDWSRNKVRRFLDNIRTAKGHHKDTHSDSHGTAKGQGVILKINNLQELKDSKRTASGQGKGQQKDSQRTTTINPKPNPLNPNPKNKDLFDIFYLEYPKKIKKKNALDKWMKLDLSNGLFDKIMNSLKKQKENTWAKTDKQYIPAPDVWLNQERWIDEIDIKPKRPWET